MKLRVKYRCVSCGKVVIMRDGRQREVRCDKCGYLNRFELKKNGKIKIV